MAFPSKQGLEDLIAQLTEVAKNYSDASDLDGFKSRVQIIEKAKEITKTLIAPADMGFYHCLNMTELVAIRTLLKVKALEAIPVNGSISLQELSKVTGAQESMLERMLRVVVGTGFLDQTRYDGGDYKHTKFSAAYIQVPGPGKFFQAMYDEYFKTMVPFDDYIDHRGFATEPDDVCNCPYTWRHKQDGVNTWAIMSSFPERIQTFQIGLSGQDAAVPIIGYYDFSKLKSDGDKVEIVDVGGGQGQSIIQILEAYPNLSASKMVLQDTKEVINLVKASKDLPTAVVKQEHDFYTENPVKGAKAYYLRRITHDYSDKANVIILSQIAKAMDPESLLLVADMVMPARVHEADLPAATMDNIMFALGGKERSEEGFKTLFAEAGLELIKVYKAPVGAGALVEARLKK